MSLGIRSGVNWIRLKSSESDCASENGLDLADLACGHAAGNFPFFRAAGVIDANIKQEAIELCLGKRIGPFLLQRVLRGQHEEWLGQHVHPPAGADLPLLHGFQHRGLGLGRCAVDFIGQQHIGKNRPGQKAIFPQSRFRIFLDDLGSRHVARHQVGRELDPLERQMQRTGQRANEQRLCQAGNAFEQGVAAGEHGDQHLLDYVALADDNFGQLLSDAVESRAAAIDGSDVVWSVSRH